MKPFIPGLSFLAFPVKAAPEGRLGVRQSAAAFIRFVLPVSPFSQRRVRYLDCFHDVRFFVIDARLGLT